MDEISIVHDEWRCILNQALQDVDPGYLEELKTSADWLPGMHALFAAFQLPLSATRYILIGESPYPRKQSANGFAFWDGSVGSLWSESGLSKEVNRATSLRNLIKMLLRARGDLCDDLSQKAIAALDKSIYVQTASQLFGAFLQKGVLLLNASLVYSEGKIPYHARQWRPFMDSLLNQLYMHKPNLRLILLGKIAHSVPNSNRLLRFEAEHPYNISFITNSSVIEFFKPLQLLDYVPEF